MTDHASYFSDWKARTFACSCGWTGPHSEVDSDVSNDVIQVSCSRCHRRLLLVSMPTHDDITRAAEAGNDEAASMLEKLSRRD